MVGDHIYEMFIYAQPPILLNMFGRIVLPIFLFLSAEGFYYTRNRLKYMSRLLIGFWGMNLGNQLIPKLFPMDELMLFNNVFGTLFLATLVMYCLAKSNGFVNFTLYNRLAVFYLDEYRKW